MKLAWKIMTSVWYKKSNSISIWTLENRYMSSDYFHKLRFIFFNPLNSCSIYRGLQTVETNDHFWKHYGCFVCLSSLSLTFLIRKGKIQPYCWNHPVNDSGDGENQLITKSPLKGWTCSYLEVLKKGVWVYAQFCTHSHCRKKLSQCFTVSAMTTKTWWNF